MTTVGIPEAHPNHRVLLQVRWRLLQVGWALPQSEGLSGLPWILGESAGTPGCQLFWVGGRVAERGYLC